MSQFVTEGGSNIIAGNEVNITIKISQGGNRFQLSGKLKVLDVSNIIDKPKKGNVIIKQGEYSSEINFNADANVYVHNIRTSLISFEILIKGIKNPNFQNSSTIKIDIPLVDGTTEAIDFEVVGQDKPIVINTFSANNRIVQQDRQSLILKYMIEGEAEKVTLFENAKELTTFTSPEQSNIPITFDHKMSGLYEYTLQATKGTQMVSQSIVIVYVQKSELYERKKPLDWTIVNFCSAQNGDYFFVLMSHDKDKTLQIGYTDQIDGRENWSIIKIADQEKLKLFVNSPMLHLQADNERKDGKLGKILFIGGSMIGNIYQAQDAGDQVAIIDLGDEGSKIDLSPLPTSFFGHSCVLFPTATDPNTIWLLGGQDEYGEPSYKIWTSSNGIEWTARKDTIPFESRVMGSVSVSWEYEKEQIKEKKSVKDALWFAGGFKEFDASGRVKADIWRYQGNKWKEITVQALDQNIKNSKALGLAYGGVEETRHTGLYFFGNTTADKYLFRLKEDSKGNFILSDDSKTKVEFSHFNQGVYITAFFRECLWVTGVFYNGSSGITYSDCYYRIPTIHENTINYYNKKP